ncbi:MAG TPA: helix-turn-helix domain-containing GNAT family N-acetyltransferase [Acidobacteriaceae bacterium]
MAALTIREEEQISAVREFNRFYTARLGLLRKRHLDGEYSLTEARMLYEIGAAPGLTASSLRNTLGLDAGYVSRTLALLTRRKLVRQAASKHDGREKLLTLLPAGNRAVAWLNEKSALHIRELLANVSSKDRDVLLESLAKIRSVLREQGERSVKVVQLTKSNADAVCLVQEYYEAISVVQRDPPGALQKIIGDPSSGVWLAYMGERAVGCVVLRRLGSIPFAAECKRLYVQPAARGHGIAEKLMDALESFARDIGFRWVYLDSHDGLKAAIALYRKRGYLKCKRYNDNPQATVFMRQNLHSRA